MVRVTVVGGGIAGTAAAWVAARRGDARVTLVSAGSGASALATGGLDFDVPGATDARALGRGSLEVLRALGAFVVPSDGGVLLATTAGVVRSARGRDAALLDWTRLAGQRVAVVRARRPGWDATALARAWRGQHGVDPVPIEATILRHLDERVIPDADFAARHDDTARLMWLSERLRDALRRAPGVSAFVLPPCLGITQPRAAALSTLVGLPCGEASALPGGPSGLRFQHARDRALEAVGVERVAARVTAIARKDDGWHVVLDGGEGREADAVVVATGGLVGGGIEYAPSEWWPGSELPAAAGVSFRFTLDCPQLKIGAHGRPLTRPGSLFGIPPEAIAWPFVADPLMDRVGALADEEGGAGDGIFAAGEVAADVWHAWLAALESGVRAGEAAATRDEERVRQRSGVIVEA